MVNQKSHRGKKDSKTITTFASQRYMLFLLFSTVILAGMGWYAWNSFNRYDKFENQRDEMAELRGTVLYFDEVLTMSAHMAASTGDLMWEKRYLKYESQLDEAIQRLKIISQDTIKYESAIKTDIANTELVVLEKQAFNLVHQGSLQAATDLLSSQKYKDLKLSYEEGMTSLMVKLKSSTKETHDKLHSKITVAVSLTAIVVLLLSFGWISLIRINKNMTSYEELEQFSSEPGNNKAFNRAAIICSIGAIFVAALGLLGWIPSLSFLGNISPHFIPMAPTASICFILLGLIVVIQSRYRLRGWSRFSAVAVTLLLSVFGIIELTECFTEICVEDFFIPEAGTLGLMRKARMSPASGATFFLSGLAALLILFGENKKKQVKVICSGSGFVGSIVFIAGVTIIMGYLYGNPLLYGSDTIPMAATTAIGFIFLGVGLVAAAGPNRMPMRLLIGYSSRARMLRIFLPLSILIVISQEILHRFVFVSYRINSALLSVLLLVFFTIITSVIVTVMAGVIGRGLDAAEEKVKELSKFPSENPNPVLRISKDGKVLYSNEAGKLLLAQWETEIGKMVPEKWNNLITQAFASGQKEEEEEVKGKIFSLTIAPVKGTGYVNIYARNITERKKVENDRKQSEMKFRTLFESSSDAIMLLDEKGFFDCNEATVKIFGCTNKDEFCSKHPADLSPANQPCGTDSISLANKQINTAMDTGSNQFEWIHKKIDGTEFPAEVLLSKMEFDGKQVLQAVVRDVTERKQAEQQLETAMHKAESANISKSRFLANMSHEIRTPMNIITGFTDLLANEEMTDDQKEYAGFIQKAGKSLLGIIDDILDYSRIEAGKLEVNLENCSLKKLLEDIDSMMRILVDEKGLEFKVIHDKKLPLIVSIDPGRVRQCLANLINNAIKFTDQGHVHLKVSMQDKGRKPFIRFDVEDTGIGIPEDKQEHIYASFAQVDETSTRTSGGTGLGLAITKQLATLLGGELTLTSQEDKGSVFSLLIPAGVDIESQPFFGKEEAEYKKSPENHKTTELSGKVLVVEDDEGCQVLVDKILKPLGLEVILAEDGIQALEKVQEQTFDLILMDMMMPNMNGYEATREIRKKGITTPIVAQTAYAMVGDREKCLEAGCDDYITKPIDRDKLLEIINKHLPVKAKV